MNRLGTVTAIINQKGGVGKSTTAVNLGAYLAAAGKKVLLIDLDPQGNATSGVGVDKSQLDRCMYDVVMEECTLRDIILPTEVAGLDVAPATIELAGAEIELVAVMSREYRVQRALHPERDRYDYVLIDSPPSLGLLTLNGMSAADGVLIPIQCEYYALEGLSQLMKTIEMVRHHLNPSLEVHGVLLTMFDARTNLSHQVAEDVREYFAGRVRVFSTVIPRNIRLSEAPSFGQPVLLYDDRSRGAEAYRQLAAEVMGV